MDSRDPKTNDLRADESRFPGTTTIQRHTNIHLDITRFLPFPFLLWLLLGALHENMNKVITFAMFAYVGDRSSSPF